MSSQDELDQSNPTDELDQSNPPEEFEWSNVLEQSPPPDDTPLPNPGPIPREPTFTTNRLQTFYTLGTYLGVRSFTAGDFINLSYLTPEELWQIERGIEMGHHYDGQFAMGDHSPFLMRLILGNDWIPDMVDELFIPGHLPISFLHPVEPRQGASADEIEALPEKPLDASKLDENGLAKCNICLVELPASEKFKELNCGHLLHGPCIETWLTCHNSCPLCRKYPAAGEPREVEGEEEPVDALQAALARGVPQPGSSAKRPWEPAPTEADLRWRERYESDEAYRAAMRRGAW